MKKDVLKKGRIAMSLSACLLVAAPATAENPQARTDAMVVAGNARFTVLTPEMPHGPKQ